MVDLPRSCSTDWAVATRIGPDYDGAKHFDRLVPADPRLLVPVDLQALVVPKGSAAGRTAATSAAACSTPTPDERLPPPFTPAADLPPGVHLHWALPDGLTKAKPQPPGGRRAGPPPASAAGSVARLPADARPARRSATERAWIVESERGRSVPARVVVTRRPG